MKFNYNNYMLEENRVIDVMNDIRKSYPNIPNHYLRIIASLEKTILSYEYSPVLEFNRLYNILFILDGDNSLADTNNLIINRLKEVYIEIINKRIANDEMIKINSIMKELINYFNGDRVIFPTMNEFNI